MNQYLGCITPIAESLIHGLFIIAKDLSEPAEWFFRHFDTISNDFLNYTGPILNVICLTSYVAMIALGSPVVGAIGLFGMALSLVKQNGYLPACLDEALIPLCMLSGLYVNLLSSQMLLFKILLVMGSGFSLLSYGMSKKSLAPYITPFLPEMRPGNHVIAPENNLNALIESKGDILEKLQSNFELNYTSLHAKPLEDVIPPEEVEALAKIDTAELYQAIEMKCQRLGVSITPIKGWNTLKNALIDGICEDQRPVNFDLTCLLLKSILQSRLGPCDEGNFEQDILELARIGNSCNEGWTRDINYLHNPNSKDPIWAIHHDLALFRGDIINGLLSEIHKIKDLPEGLRGLDVVGGTNNIHLLNQLQASLWHRWRPFGGELHLATSGRGLFLRWLQQDSQVEKNKTLLDIIGDKGVYSGAFMKEVVLSGNLIELPLPLPPFYFVLGLDQTLYSRYRPDNIVQRIENRIAFQNIPWDVITTWLADLNRRGFDGVMDLDSRDYNPALVGGSGTPTPYLTESGVKLLLWDLGILHPTTEV